MMLARTVCLAMLASALALTTSCSATGKWKNVGEPPMWNTELPPPPADEGVVQNAVKVVLQCPLMEDQEEFIEELRSSVVEQCRKAGMGEVTLLRDRSKKAQYEIVVYEAGEDGKFDFNEEAGIWAGVGAGVATGLLTESLGYGIVGGAVGGAAVGALLGEKKERYAFAGVCRQRTSLQADKVDSQGRNNRTSSGGGLTDRDSAVNTSGGTGREMFESAQWNYKTSAYEFPFMFMITVDGGSMSSKDTRDQAAREVFVKRFPKFVTGGTVL